ncbi:SHOCT-like domain-containing protein [Paenibacillus ihumii]
MAAGCFVKKLAIEERISLEDARLIIEKYNAERRGG